MRALTSFWVQNTPTAKVVFAPCDEPRDTRMKPERWQQVRDVLHEAMQMDESERSAFLKSQCAADPSLRAELNELLAAEGEIGSSFLESPALVHAAVHTGSAATGTVLAVGTKPVLTWCRP
jgi:hypothetical protein